MPDPHAQRTLVKSPPELWAEVSDLGALARHLGEFGEIRITRTEPETTVAWEGDRVRGTVHLEPSGWGTKVTLTAELAEPEPEPVAAEPEPVAAEPEAEPAVPEAATPEPAAEPLPAAEPPAVEPEEPRAGLFARLFGRRRKAEAEAVVPEVEPVAAVPEPVAPEPELVAPELEPEPEPLAPEPEPAAAVIDGERAQAILTGVLDDLGSAHHRPFSRG